MRVLRTNATTKEPWIGVAREALRQRGRDAAARMRRAWARSCAPLLASLWSVLRTRVRDRRWRARVCLAAGAVLGLVVLGGLAYRARLPWTLARAIQRAVGRGPDAAPAGGSRPRNALPSLHLELAPHAYQALSMQQQKAWRNGILWPQEAQPVAAELTLDGESSALRRAMDRHPPSPLEVQVRLAGSRCDGVHPLDLWRPAKWSLEVQIAPSVAFSDLSFLGAKAFTLHSPALRGYLAGWLYKETLYRAGLVPAPTALVNLVLNGEHWGIYLLEPDLEPGGTAWFESLDAEQKGRLLAHADLWGREIPGACGRGPDATEPALRVVAADPRARGAYKREAARITRSEYVAELRAAYRRSVERGQRALGDEFFSAHLEEPWDLLLERQTWLAAWAAGMVWEDAAALKSEGGTGLPRTSARSTLPSDLVPAAQPSVEDVLRRHPFLVRSDQAGFLSVKAGDWLVEGDLVLPKGVGLWSSEPFSLRFARGAMLVAQGPLILHGAEGAEIRLLPQEDHWGGVRVLRADPATASSWRSVEVRGARGSQSAASTAVAQAGILFYSSPIVLDRCRVLDSYAPAAFSVLHAPFDIRDSEFGAAAGDLVQVLAAQGTISRSAFHDALGAAVRFEQSEVEIVDVSVRRVRGEALWAGPESRGEVRGLRADRVGVGLASEGAWARVRDARVGGAAAAAFLAYAGASLDLGSVVFEDGSVQALIQEGSEAVLDGVPIETRAFAAEELLPPVEPAPAMSPLGVRFGPSIWLVGYELTTPERAPGETIEVILYWRAFAYLDRQYTIFMHVRDAAGETVAGWDMMPRYNTFPTTDWPLVERIDDAHIVPLSKDLPPGEYTVALGMYDWATGVRLPAYTRSGEPLPEATLILKERVTVLSQ